MAIEEKTIQNYERRLAVANREIARLMLENSSLCYNFMLAMSEVVQLRKQVQPSSTTPQDVGGFKVYQ